MVILFKLSINFIITEEVKSMNLKIILLINSCIFLLINFLMKNLWIFRDIKIDFENFINELNEIAQSRVRFDNMFHNI